MSPCSPSRFEFFSLVFHFVSATCFDRSESRIVRLLQFKTSILSYQRFGSHWTLFRSALLFKIESCLQDIFFHFFVYQLLISDFDCKKVDDDVFNAIPSFPEQRRSMNSVEHQCSTNQESVKTRERKKQRRYEN